MTMDEDGTVPAPADDGLQDAPELPGFSSHANRRTFLKGAALGTAAAAMYEGGALFKPLTAFADNLSGLNCTANDVRIIGPGQIINEPCTCTNTFNAQVRFRVVNNTGTTRYCVTVHFCPGALPGGGNFDPGDIRIGDIPPKSDAFYTVTIPNYPCGSGLVCFGACGTGTDPDTGVADCSFAKGEACPTGQCCTTISWDVNPGCPSRVISSKCRHQQVCIQGRGATTLACPTSGCAVPCGGSLALRVCTSEPASQGPFVYRLYTRSGTTDTLVATYPTTGTTTDTCHTFNVSPTANTTYVAKVTSTADNCVKTSNTVNVTVTQISPTISVSGASACDGVLTFTASTTGCETYAWTVDGVAAGTNSRTLPYQPRLDGVCHTVGVTVTCSGCTGSATKKISQCATTTVDCT